MWLTKRWCAWLVEPAIASFWGLSHSLGPRCGPWLVASHILGSRYCADCTVPRPRFPSGAPGHALHFQLTASVVTAHRVWHDRVQRQSAACDQLAAGSWKRIGVPETTHIFILRQCRDIYIYIYIYVCVLYIYIHAIWWCFIFVPLILCTIFRSQFSPKCMKMLHFKRTCTTNDRQDTLLAEHWQLW